MARGVLLLRTANDPIAAGFFGKIEGFIGQLQQIRTCRWLVGVQGGNPNAHRYRPLTPLIAERSGLDQGTDLLGNKPGVTESRIGESNDKFLAAEAGSQIAKTDMFLHQHTNERC